MNKKELIRTVAGQLGYTQKDVTAVIETACEVIGNTVKDGTEVSIIGFGKFKPVLRKATTGRNPNTGEAMEIPEKTMIRFAPSAALKNLVAGK